MTTPKRIQRKRTKGWKMPKGAIYVGRGSKWGNEYRVVRTEGVWEVVWGSGAYGEWACRMDAQADALWRFKTFQLTPELIAAARRELKGKDLCCWCPLPKPGERDLCHRSILLEIANSGDTQ